MKNDNPSNNSTRSISSILSTSTPSSSSVSITPVQKSQPQVSQSPTAPDGSSVLGDAIKNNGQAPLTPNDSNSIKIQTYQLVNSSQNSSPNSNNKPSAFQKINQLNSQPITKTIVTTTNASSSPQLSSNFSNNYKVLAQQLPVGKQQTSVFTIKQISTNTVQNKPTANHTIQTTTTTTEETSKPIVTTTPNKTGTVNPTPVTLTAISPSPVSVTTTTPIRSSTSNLPLKLPIQSSSILPVIPLINAQINESNNEVTFV